MLHYVATVRGLHIHLMLNTALIISSWIDGHRWSSTMAVMGYGTRILRGTCSYVGTVRCPIHLALSVVRNLSTVSYAVTEDAYPDKLLGLASCRRRSYSWSSCPRVCDQSGEVWLLPRLLLGITGSIQAYKFSENKEKNFTASPCWCKMRGSITRLQAYI